MANARKNTRTNAGRAAARVRIVLSTAPAKAASRLAKRLVDSRLAVCVNVVPGVVSTYRWRGKVERARESLVIVKTPGRDLPALLAALESAHPYEVPEGLVLEPVDGLTPYLEWIAESGR